jgi:hypothetical protein
MDVKILFYAARLTKFASNMLNTAKLGRLDRSRTVKGVTKNGATLKPIYLLPSGAVWIKNQRQIELIGQALEIGI